MTATTTPTHPLLDLLTSILVIATRMLRDIHRHTSTTPILKSILAGTHAATRVGRAVRLATLLIIRIRANGLLPLPPARPRTTPAATRTPRAQSTTRFHTGNGDVAFARRPIPTIIAAIIRELQLAALIVGTPLPESLQNLCLHATLASTGLDTPQPPAQPTLPTPIQTPQREPGSQTHTPAPSKTLEL